MKTRSLRAGVAIGFGVIVVSIAVAWWQREVGMQRGIEVIGRPGATADPQGLSAAIDHALYAIVGGIVGVLVGIAIIVRAVVVARRR